MCTVLIWPLFRGWGRNPGKTFVVFWGDLKTTKGHFEINWPLGRDAFYKRNSIHVILFEIDCTFFYRNLNELSCHFISWTNWVNSGKFMDNCWIPCQVIADMENFYDNLISINLYFYLYILFQNQLWCQQKLCTVFENKVLQKVSLIKFAILIWYSVM